MYWQMLLQYLFVTDGIATIFGLCCAKWCTTVVVVAFLADVVAKLA